MNLKKVLLLVLFFFSVSFLAPKTSKAVDLQQVFTSEDSIVVKIQEGIEYLFTFKVENKVTVLEKHAEKRLVMAQGYAEKGKIESVQSVLQSYLQIKGRQNDLLGKSEVEDMLGAVEESTIEQQITLEDIKTKIDEDGKQKVISIQERVVNQIAKRIIEINGPEGQTEFFNKVEHVWAPGTGPGGEVGTTFAPGTSGAGTGGVTIKGGGTQFAPGTSGGGSGGVVVEGGTIQFAPGTSAGGTAGSDIKTVDIKTGGTVNETVPVPDGPNYAPGTSGNSPGNIIDQGSVDPGNNGTQTIDP